MTTARHPINRADARDRILDAAEAIAMRDGASHLTLDAAAREAGVSKGGVLYHYPSKRALHTALIDRSKERLLAAIDARRAELASEPNPTLRALIEIGREILRNGVALRGALVAAVAEDPTLIHPIRAEFQRLWSAIRSECGDPTGAFVIWSALEGLQFFAIFGVAPFELGDGMPYFDRLDQMVRALPGKDRNHAS